MSRLDTAQVEQLEEIGVYLKGIREQQGKSLDEIATKTFIPLRLLKAIEAGNAHPLPEPVFVQGFIRRYAEVLGLNGVDLSQRFSIQGNPNQAAIANASSPPVAPEPTHSTPQTPPTEPSPPIAAPPVGHLMDPTTSPSAPRPNWVPAYVVGGLIVLMGLGYAIAGQFRAPAEAPAVPEALTEPEAPPQSPQPAPETPAIAASPPANPNPAVSPTPYPQVSSAPTQPSPAANGGPVAVNVNFQGTSWVEVTIDGEVAFEGTLEAGTQRTWSGKEQVTIVAGNAGAVLVSYNQGQATPMGGLGEVQERSFPPVSTAQTVQTEP